MFNDTQPGFRRLRSIIAERTNRIVLWLGAGLSIPAGLPSWYQLRETLCCALVDKASAGEPEELDAAQKIADQIRSMNDYWLAFQRLQDSLGPATYRATIRESLKSAETCTVPENYSLILDLPVTGILTLNLDRLATRAYTLKHPGKYLVEFGGFEAERHLHVLKGATPFILNLHGTLSDEYSGALTRQQLLALLKQDGYNTFVRSCLSTRTIVFMGISADDVAVGGHLEALADASLGDHFWITDRTDENTQYWAERTQLQLIRYRSKDNDHSELRELLTELGSYKPKDENPDPVAMACVPIGVDLPSPDELNLESDLEKIRELLNAHAAYLLQPNSETGKIDYEQYNRFCKEYDEAIYRAWYVSSSTPRNKLFGYTIENELTDGAFGRVFRARDQRGRPVAIKVLRGEVRRKPDMLQSFRRGVRSMRILADREVQGMIPYEEASEIPAVAVMEFVEGPNLQVAVQAGFLNDWPTVLEVAVQIAGIIRRAHLLPERVLHRDLRPPNIMLKDYYKEPEKLNVVILDFDLSWHLGAQEESIVNRSSLGGFLAPEQVIPNTEMSTRSAAVDSFGIGMTLYYLRTSREPQYLEHKHKTWEEDLTQAILVYPCESWKSVPMRFSRLILNSTKDKQTERWDMGRIEGELQLLKESALYPEKVRSAELLAEELTQRVMSFGGYPRYSWDLDRICASLWLPSGVELRIAADERDRSVKVQIEWSNRGDREHKNVRKFLKPAMDEAISSLQARGWKLLPLTHLRSSEAGFAVSIGTDELAAKLQFQAEEIATRLNRFSF